MAMITPVYAGLLGLLFFWLSLRVSLIRMKGPAPDEQAAQELRRAVRAQGNASEYIPLGLILLLVLEFQSAPGWIVHLSGLALLIGRLGHYVSFSLIRIRLVTQISMVLTYGMVCFSGLVVLYHSLIG